MNITRSRGGPAAAARDPELFEEFYREHVDAVTRFLARRVDDPHTVADLTAEVFLAVIDSGHTYRPALGTERGWLYGVARNVVSAERRRTARQHVLNGRVAGRRLLAPDDIARLEEKLVAENEGRRLVAALAELPEGERALLELITADELSVSEAARALGIRPTAARVRLHRARGRLRAALAGNRGTASAETTSAETTTTATDGAVAITGSSA
ncbi:RNA polymerase sigma factor [Streptomyces sp. 8K308]|uniref:RNA polymerase sigma factor n=1 Tax=Streptomyces sp. 8K308 TaxID=2530388 RepID=UPI0010523F90|nr:RNA polymerase sigma factor [Streptomyces sp. 8K308]TDC19217.1 RNA polymerase sigma factor [Streptomyces sp. 8K308]